MDAFIHLIDATYCRSSHHRLALDALALLQCSHTRRWQRIILKHYKDYLEGSKAPDTEFKDFRNHVLHVRQNNWGGAPGTANEWYHLTVEAARQQAWRNVAYSAGVLSHYITDPIHPFHTGQSDEESTIHRAFEWSTCKAFRQIRPLDDVVQGIGNLHLPDSENWLEEALIEGATFANQYYETLIREYDFQVGKSWPASGLNENCRQIIGELIQYGSRLFALILSRALEEADSYPPQVLLYPEAIFATAKAPVRVAIRTMEDVKVRYELLQMYDEWERTGKVVNCLPEDDREIRSLVQSEFGKGESRRVETPSISEPTIKIESVSTRPTRASEPEIKVNSDSIRKPIKDRIWDRSVKLFRSRRDQQDESSDSRREKNRERKVQPTLERETRTLPASPQRRADDSRKGRDDSSRESNTPQRSNREDRHVQHPRESEDRRASSAPRYYLTLHENIEAAPSIGAKTAKRLERVGVVTVNDLLNADPANVARRLEVSWISRDTVQDWQDQTALVCRVPGMRGHDAQLLVANDYRDVADVAAANPKDMFAEINRFCQTADGQRIIRSGKKPDKQEIREWITSAQQARSLADAG